MITFIIPSFNQGEFIKESIDSILNAMGPEDQIVIQDAASTDNTVEVVKPYLSDKRIEWYSEKDRGFSEGIERALGRAKHDIIGIQSSDDSYRNGANFRSKVLQAFSDKNVVGVYADYHLIDQQGNDLWRNYHKRGAKAIDYLSLQVILPQSSFFFRKSALENFEILNLKYDYVADVVLFNQIACAGEIVFFDEVWSNVRIQPGSRTGKRNPGEQYIDALNDKVFGSDRSLIEERRALASAKLLAARYQASSGKRMGALKTFLGAVSVDAAILGHWLTPKTMNYIVLGPEGMQKVKSLLKPFRVRRSQ